MLRERGTQSCDDDEGCQHARGRDEPKGATTKAFCADRTAESEEGIPDLEGKIDTSLYDRAGDANALEDWCQVVYLALVDDDQIARIDQNPNAYKTRFRCPPTGS